MKTIEESQKCVTEIIARFFKKTHKLCPVTGNILQTASKQELRNWCLENKLATSRPTYFNQNDEWNV